MLRFRIGVIVERQDEWPPLVHLLVIEANKDFPTLLSVAG